MKLINQSVEYLPQPEGIVGIYQQIERAARCCYKSESKSDGNSMAFVSKLINMGHNSMLEHGTVYLKAPVDHSSGDYIDFDMKYTQNPYSRLIYESGIAYVTTNYRVLVENNWVDDIQKYSAEHNVYHQKRYTFRIVTSISIGRELTRHRAFSFAQESTRYVNLNKKGEFLFIKPYWYENDTKGYTEELLHICENSIQAYTTLINTGLSPQQAREVLPLCTKSELIMTGFEDDWKNFLDIRLKGTTGKPHPDMVLLAKLIEDELYKINGEIKIRTEHEPYLDDVSKYNNEFPSLKDELNKIKEKYTKKVFEDEKEEK